MEIIKTLFSNSKRLFFLSTLVGMLSGLFFMGLIGYINYFVSKGTVSLGYTQFVYFCVFLIVVFTLNFFSQRVMAYLGLEVTHNLMVMLMRRVLGTSLRKVEIVGKSRLYASVTQDVGAVNEAINILPPIIVNSATLLTGIVYMACLSWKIVLVQAVLLTSLVLVAKISTKILRKLLYRTREKSDILYQHFEGFFEGLKELKLNSLFATHYLDSKFVPLGLSLKSLGKRVSSIFALSFVLYDAFFFLAIGFTVFVFPLLFGVESGVATAIAFVFLFIRSPALMLYNTAPTLARGDVALKKILSITEAELDGAASEIIAERENREPWTGLELVDVEYQYAGNAYLVGDKPFHLGPVSMSVKPGEVVFIAGGNGAGKSTLAKIITGLYTPQSGLIHLNGQVLGAGDERKIRKYFSAIFSDFYLFRDMAEIYMDQETSDRLGELLVKLQLHTHVDLKNNIIPTNELSSGQRKRLALLFAMASERPVFLLDEWAADQDPQFREYFYCSIIPALKAAKKGIVVISHDDRYFGCADKLYKLDRGVFIELDGENLKKPALAEPA